MSGRQPIRCAIYTRKSSEEGLEQEFNSLDAQREACEAYILSQKAEGWTVISDHFDDGGYSGGTLERPALRALLAEIEAGRVDVVVVYKIDRLSRSLMDFAKLVEVLDRKNVTFVSVTQSFNTTTSMGRLTLNVLLSFAQFEREVTGERIRDKFAASKKKGMWMGGNIPLGYDLQARKLVVNPAEAKTVRLIFQRYLDLGCVRVLRDDLKQKGIRSKQWISSTQTAHGGLFFERGGLYCLLRNRLYIGEVLHKGASYPGEHEAIVPVDLFDAVQQRLATTRRRQLGKRSAPQDAPLAGILFDEAGSPMTPTYSVKPGGRRYRYYVSTSDFRDDPAKVSIPRIPAAPLEAVVGNAMRRLALPGSDSGIIRRVDIRPDSIAIRFEREPGLRAWRTTNLRGFAEGELIRQLAGSLGPGEALADGGNALLLTLPVRARFRGGRAGMLALPSASPPPAGPDRSLIKALARAHRWKDWLMSGEVRSVDALAIRVGQERRHVGRTLSLAFLSPTITKAILRGVQPAGLRLAHLLDADIPLSWREQDALIDRLVRAEGRAFPA
ncbi:MAG TPA: recombinase family protein [Rhizomicrobium sp.]|nr:recombinase family protein [Rhizomicrobium sp.]